MSNRNHAARPAETESPEVLLLRLDPALIPGRFRPRHLIPKLNPLTSPLQYMRLRNLPGDEWFEKGRKYAITGDPLADDYAVLYPTLGYARARGMLDTALEKGIEQVPDAPPALKALFAELDRPPAWVDWKRVENGAAVMRRYAHWTWLFSRLAFAQTFVNANAGTPLYMTGSLGEKTVARRLKETSRWRLELHQPGSLRRFGPGFKTVVRVRVLHALIRMHIFKSGEWDVESLGMPIPQLDMAGANIGMFLTHSVVPRLLGARMTTQEYADVMHLWRYHGYAMGVQDELNPTSHKHMKNITRQIVVTLRDKFDPRGLELTRATMNAHLREGGDWLDRILDEIDIRASHGFYYLVNGREIYTRMGLTNEKRWLWFGAAVFPWMFAAETVRKWMPGGNFIASEIGRRYVEKALAHEVVKNAAFNPYPATR